MSRDVRKPDFCICENKDADQLRGNREADQRLCFRCKDSTIPLFPKSEISSILPSSVAAQPGLCRTWSDTLKTSFLKTRLMCNPDQVKVCLAIVSRFCMFCAYTRPRYQVSVYRTIGPLVCLFFLVLFCYIYTMRHKFSNFHLIFKMQIGMK